MKLKQIALCIATAAALTTSFGASAAVTVKPVVNATPAPASTTLVAAAFDTESVSPQGGVLACTKKLSKSWQKYVKCVCKYEPSNSVCPPSNS